MDVITDGSGAVPVLQEGQPEAAGAHHVLALGLIDLLAPALFSPPLLPGVVGTIDRYGPPLLSVHQGDVVCSTGC